MKKSNKKPRDLKSRKDSQRTRQRELSPKRSLLHKSLLLHDNTIYNKRTFIRDVSRDLIKGEFDRKRIQKRRNQNEQRNRQEIRERGKRDYQRRNDLEHIKRFYTCSKRAIRKIHLFASGKIGSGVSGRKLREMFKNRKYTNESKVRC